MAKDSVVIQDLTYTARNFGDAITVTYVNGSALSVSVSGRSITVTINTGTSTATQIAAAVNTLWESSQLVVVTVSGTGSNVQKTCKNHALSGGVTTAVKATLTTGNLKYTADTAGTGGNNIRIKYTSGATAGSEVVTVSSNDITVQIENGVSTFAQIKTAVEADSGAAALVDLSSAGGALSSKCSVAMCPTFINLSGGLAATPASVENQDVTVTSITNNANQNGLTLTYTTGSPAPVAATLVVEDITYTAVDPGSSGNDITITYVDDGTAGSETVDVTGTDIVVHMDDTPVTGSTAQNIYDAVTAETDATDLVSLEITGTAGDVQSALTETPLAGGSDGAVVTVDGDGNISVAIDSGVNDAQDIVDALNDETDFTDLYTATVSGTGTAVQYTVNGATLTGATDTDTNGFYKDQALTALTSSFVRFNFNGWSESLLLANDETSGSKQIIYSWDGVNTHGKLNPTQSISIQNVNRTNIWMKYGTGAPNYRLIVKNK